MLGKPGTPESGGSCPSSPRIAPVEPEPQQFQVSRLPLRGQAADIPGTQDAESAEISGTQDAASARGSPMGQRLWDRAYANLLEDPDLSPLVDAYKRLLEGFEDSDKDGKLTPSKQLKT